MQTCLLDILDTAGQEEYSAMRDHVGSAANHSNNTVFIIIYIFNELPPSVLVCVQYVRTGECFLMVYSITSRSSFDQVKSLYDWTMRIRDGVIPMASLAMWGVWRGWGWFACKAECSQAEVLKDCS